MFFGLIKSACNHTNQYYYDFAADSYDDVPEKFIKHFKKCKSCKSQVHRLKEAINQVPSNQHQKNSLVTDMLSLHFKYIEENVTCSITRPFLPAITDNSLRISIESPITAHIDKCDKCRKDIKILGSLNLVSRQLYIIAQIFTMNCSNDVEICQEAKKHIKSFVELDFENTPPSSLRQICICKTCSDKAFNVRKNLIEKLNYQSKDCESPLKYSDLFDFCVPFSIDTKILQNIHQAMPAVAHVSKCPDCLGKINQLHKAIYDIRQRPDSDITTVFSFSKNTISIKTKKNN